MLKFNKKMRILILIITQAVLKLGPIKIRSTKTSYKIKKILIV